MPCFGYLASETKTKFSRLLKTKTVWSYPYFKFSLLSSFTFKFGRINPTLAPKLYCEKT